MTFHHQDNSTGAYVRERRDLLVSVTACRREGPILRVSLSSALAASLGWSAGERLSVGIGEGGDAGWIELAPSPQGRQLCHHPRGSRLVWNMKGLAGAPARHRVGAASYVKASAQRRSLRILLPWWRAMKVAA